MIIDLQKCRERPLEVDPVLDLTACFAGAAEIATIEPVLAHLTVQSTGARRFRVTGTVQTRIEPWCGRCLEAFALPLERSFELTFLPADQRPRPGAGEFEMDASQVDVSYYEEDRIEIEPMVEEQVQLALPMRFLCRQDCRGLCQHCGANRNLTDCGCVEPVFDPRLEALKALRH